MASKKLELDKEISLLQKEHVKLMAKLKELERKISLLFNRRYNI